MSSDNFGQDLKRRLDAVVEEVARDNNTTPQEVLRKAREFLDGSEGSPVVELREQLARAGIDPKEIESHWVELILHYRQKGRCMSVNYSTTQFIPILSKCLAALKP